MRNPEGVEPRSTRATWGFVAASLGILALPVLVIDLPPVLDYPNHLARLWVIAGGRSPYYEILWNGAATNIGIDLMAASIGTVIPAGVLGPACLLLALILPPLGAILLNRTVFGGSHWWQIGFCLTAWNVTFLAGFLNFQIALGLALVASSFDANLSRRGSVTAFAGRFIVAALLSVVHLFGTLLYGVLLCGLAFGSSFAAFASLSRFARQAGTGIAIGLTAALPLVLNLVLSPSRPGDQLLPTDRYFEWAVPFPQNVFGVLSAPFRTYDIKVDAAFAAFIVLVLAACFTFGRIRAHAGLAVAAVSLLLISILVPSHVAGTTFIDRRLAVMAILVGMPAIRPELERFRTGLLVVSVAVFAAFCLRTAWISTVWMSRQADVTAVRRALEMVEPRSKILPLENSPSIQVLRSAPKGRYIAEFLPTYWHLAALGVPLREAFVPNIFSAKGKQPLRVLPPVDEIAVPEGRLASVGLLTAALQDIPTDASYIRFWRTGFDYVLLLNADLPDESGPMQPLSELSLVSDQGFARLYKVVRRGPNSMVPDAQAGRRS